MKISRCFGAIALELLAFLFCLFGLTAIAGSKDEMLVYFGTYTGARSRGIYLSRFNPNTGVLSAPELAAETRNPSFLALPPNNKFLYAISEKPNLDGSRMGGVSAFGIDPATGALTLLNQQSTGGSGPCHVSVDRTGVCLLVANYGSGGVAALPVSPDGRLNPPSTIIQHEGSSVDPQRQKGPHAHFIIPDPGNRFALACDLGLDKILVYRFEPGSGRLAANERPFAAIKPGSGPRHLAFDPAGQHVYLLNEMAGTLTVFQYAPQSGGLRELQTISTLVPDFKGANTSAEVQVHPNGKFVYASNRGDSTLAVFAVDSATGLLTSVQHQSSGGKTPRHFALVPGGNWLLAENQDSDNVVVFRIDPKTGCLAPAGQQIQVGAPVCSVFLQPSDRQ